jgi:hypothetical protein
MKKILSLVPLWFVGFFGGLFLGLFPFLSAFAFFD